MNAIKKIVIVGGGTAGWITAAILSQKYPKSLCEIELIESDEIGTIGVGESTIPPFLDFLEELNIDLVDFIQKTHASFKLGIEFVDWKMLGTRYFHPFGHVGVHEMSNRDFFHSFIKLKQSGSTLQLYDFSISYEMAMQSKFSPNSSNNSVLSDSRFALHIDATLAATYFCNYAQSHGVLRKEGLVADVIQNKDGSLASIILATEEEIHADFFIDCTGFHSLLIEKTLNVGFEDWSAYLPCDKAVVVQTETTTEAMPYTRATACDSGWVWQIPLQNRVGNGYVYASKFCSDDEAKKTLLTTLNGALLSEPRVISFKTGVRHKMWEKNCLAIGLASGFVEPLESTAIHMVVRGVVNFLKYFPSLNNNDILREQYNKQVYREYQEIRDFIILHYCLTQRKDTPFWQYCNAMELPFSLQNALDLYAVHGEIPSENLYLFQETSWWAVANGMGLSPQFYNALVDINDNVDLEKMFSFYAKKLKDFVAVLPAHTQFIKDNCVI